MHRVPLILVALSLACPRSFGQDDSDHPLPVVQRRKMAAEWESAVERLTEAIEAAPTTVDLYSRRGDAYFFRGEFEKALADYEKMAALNPRLDNSHWRRGIAYFYAGQFEQAARQFERYHTFDDVDRENGIWRFLSQSQAYGLDKAREGLLKYRKDDREPFPAVYRMFAGEIDGEDVLKQIEAADIDQTEREKRLFYAHLYIGLNDAVQGRKKSAQAHLRQATGNRWGPRAGYGPHFMWQVGRLHYEQLAKRYVSSSAERKKPADD